MLFLPKCTLRGGNKRRHTSPLSWSCWWRWRGVGIVVCIRCTQQCAIWCIQWFHNLQEIIFLPIINQFAMIQLWLPIGQKMEPIMGRLFIRSSPPSSENADQNCEIMFLSPNLGKCILVGAIAFTGSFQAGVSCLTEETCLIVEIHGLHFALSCCTFLAWHCFSNLMCDVDGHKSFKTILNTKCIAKPR